MMSLKMLLHRLSALPDGKVFMVANNQSIIYETDTEAPLPGLPNGVRVMNPLNASVILLPLSPPDHIDDHIEPENLHVDYPASSQCSRIKLTDEGIAKGWEIEHMLEGCTMH